jgi:hypothetical protein
MAFRGVQGPVLMYWHAQDPIQGRLAFRSLTRRLPPAASVLGCLCCLMPSCINFLMPLLLTLPASQPRSPVPPGCC